MPAALRHDTRPPASLASVSKGPVSGLVLLGAAALAMIWASSPFSRSYFALWQTPLLVRLGSFAFEKDLVWFVDDGLMAIFFFFVGLEMRREMHNGVLSRWKRAALPAAAALGGMVAPALIYLGVAGGPQTRPGWGVPMATDIAFAVGLVALLGKRVPRALQVLLLALAVIDDLGAIVVIALFYSSGVSIIGFAIAAVGLASIALLQRLRIRRRAAYLLPALVAWGGVYAAGIHPTIAGVIIGMMTPVVVWPRRDGSVPSGASPADRLTDLLRPWVAFFIMPVFALANAGVPLAGLSIDGPGPRIMVAVVFALVLGKPLGVVSASYLSVKLGIGALPEGIGLRQLIVLGVVAGVGFTMSLFVAQLAFDDAHLLGAAKLGVVIASTVAGLSALAVGRLLLPLKRERSR